MRASPFQLLARLVVGGALGVYVACSSTPPPGTNSPITGILVHADSLVAGRGCGTRGSQIYRYVAVVFGADNVPITGAAYDCFADGTFVNLSAGDSGSYSFTVQIWAYNFAAYAAQNGGSSMLIERAASAVPPDVAALKGLKATYTTTCQAMQQANVEVLAVCDPLRSPQGNASISLPTGAFPLADGGSLPCGVGYDTVSATETVNGTTGDAGAVRCTDPLNIDPAAAPADYVLHVQLSRIGAVVAKGTCHAATSPGLPQVTATCDPLLE